MCLPVSSIVTTDFHLSEYHSIYINGQKNGNSNMKKKFFVLALICVFFAASYAQECELKLQTAQYYRDKGNYKEAVVWYQRVLNDCGDYNGNVKNELKKCKNKIKAPRTPDQYIPAVKQDASLNDTRVSFDAAGGTDSHIRVTCNGEWFFKYKVDWISVSKNGDMLIVDCYPNTKQEPRSASFPVIAGDGTCMIFISVQQDAGENSPGLQNVVPTSGGKIVFESGNTTPVFDYKREDLTKIIETLKKEKNASLMLELPWCRSQCDMQLIEQRKNNVKDYFIASGVEESRIIHVIFLAEEENGKKICDEAYLRVVVN